MANFPPKRPDIHTPEKASVKAENHKSSIEKPHKLGRSLRYTLFHGVDGKIYLRQGDRLLADYPSPEKVQRSSFLDLNA
ncbi:uncharacterized protein EAF01_008044 [Botrytis porri]|uniref:Uncharacterized protein n=1 Tax=Botrytis porri TaxID=87229 RepID=A0A4Z1KWH0_9HELO|nr:uncharacterized protein EAF01_008044 [Botrytis porri]KAF7898831.1 hypothetical protein EAF01_008044 [Botrytis porri]TGO88889.1 hypothetical protein BPOR_0136g00130 [Botrytis porri]